MSGAGRTVWLLLPAKASKDPGQVFASVGGRGGSGVRLMLQPPLHELLQIDLRKTQPRPSEPACVHDGWSCWRAWVPASCRRRRRASPPWRVPTPPRPGRLPRAPGPAATAGPLESPRCRRHRYQSPTATGCQQAPSANARPNTGRGLTWKAAVALSRSAASSSGGIDSSGAEAGAAATVASDRPKIPRRPFI